MVDQQYDTLFLGYIEGDLTPEQILEFENILVQDARLRNLVAQLVIDRSRMRRLPREDAPAELMERVNQQIERRMLLNGSLNAPLPAGMSPERRFRLNRIMSYAAVAAMVAITASFMYWMLSDRGLLDLTHKPPPLPRLAKSPKKIEGQQLADARSGRDAMKELRRGTALDDNERPREIARQAAAAPPTVSRETSSNAQLFGNGAAAEKSKPENSPMGLPQQPAAAPPQMTDRGVIFSENKKEAAPAAAPAPPAAESASSGGKLDTQTALADKDRPVPAGLPKSAMFYEPSGVRLEVASPWPDVSRREVVAWANRHGAQVVTHQDQTAKDAIIEDVEKVIRDKSTGSGESDRAVVIMLANKQVPDLVAFLSTQKGQTATLTQVVTPPAMTMAAHAERTDWKNAGDQAAVTRGERAATQPASQPAGKGGAVVEAKVNEPQEPVKRMRVEAETVVLPNNPDAVMKLEVIIEPRGVDR